ncbi:MAG TPA: cytochrome c3 family protein [Kofleriaceae bacterium]|nr:cytochrome c3 family protein [Kofleriaceae bacterium]
MVLLVARSAPEAAAEVEPGGHEAVKVKGRAASAGDVRSTPLHAAHVRGAEPVACDACHRVDPQGFTPPDRELCLNCHPERSAALHAQVDNAEVRQCRRCHDFLDDAPIAEGAWKCAECHKEPHKGQQAMGGGTASEICGRCHSPHGDQAQMPTACIGCHEDKVNRHQVSTDPTKSCLACHGQHDDKRLANGRCAGCHATTRPIVPATALFAGGHESCTSCHKPHEFARQAAAACTSCHAGQKALAADKVGAHANCRSCHDQHDVKKVSGQSCRRCHDRFTPAHPSSDKGDSCLGCHPAHPGTRQIVRACSSCHQKASSDRAFHGGARCSECHREHQFKLTPAPQLCLGCHAGRVGSKAPVITSTGHAECRRCHGGDVHQLNAPPACGTCHAPEASTAPRGHARCLNCHEQHTGSLRRSAATCTNCHADRKAGVHAGVPGGCTTCHRQHGPKGVERPPACTSCHDRGKLPGLHVVDRHATCTDCHGSHKPKIPSPATCRGCHVDKRDHEPTATSCVGCHDFGKGGP